PGWFKERSRCGLWSPRTRKCWPSSNRRIGGYSPPPRPNRGVAIQVHFPDKALLEHRVIDRMARSIPALLSVVLLSTPLAGPHAKVKVWHHSTPAHYDKARLKEVVVSNEGALRLARQLRPLVTLDATHVWDLVEDKDGNLYAATGNEG